MGTSYKLYDNDGSEITIDEMSNKLSLVISIQDYSMFGDIGLYELKPVELLKIFMEGIKVCSYYMSEEEFDAVFSKLETYAY